MPVPVKFVNDGEARILSVIIYTANVYQVIEPEFFPGELAYLLDLLGLVANQGQFASKFGWLRKQFAKSSYEFICEFECVHRR